MDKNLEIHPSAKQKQQELLSLKEQLTDLIAQKDHLLCTKKKNLEALYVLKIGKYEYQLLELECAVARLKRKIALLQASLNKGQDIDLEDIEQTLNQEYKKWEEKIKKLAREVKQADKRIKSLLSTEDSKLLQKLYRKLVKILHPDLNKDADSNQKILWQRLQDAYKSGDLEEIKLIDMLATSIQDKELKDQDQLDKAIQEYGQKIRNVSDQIVAILASFPFDIEKNLNNQEWIKQKVNECMQKIKEQKDYQQKLKAVIDKLLIENFTPGKPVEG